MTKWEVPCASPLRRRCAALPLHCVAFCGGLSFLDDQRHGMGFSLHTGCLSSSTSAAFWLFLFFFAFGILFLFSSLFLFLGDSFGVLCAGNVSRLNA